MPFDPEALGPDARARYLEVGVQFGSSDVLRQLDASIKAADTHAAVLSASSFPMALVERAKEVRDALVAAGVQRAVAQIGKKATNASLVNAVREGKGLRSVARAALSGARTQLFEQGNTKAVNTIDATFASTRESGADAAKLGEQLTTLADVLADADIAGVMGAAAASLQTQLTTARDTLETARRAKGNPHGTVVETERVNVLDGAGVTYVREMRKAARALVRITGRTDIADEFELRELYGTSRSSSENKTTAT